MLKRMINKLREKKLTISEELERQGYISHEDLIADLIYNRQNVHIVWCTVYIITVIPIVLGMRVSVRFCKLVAKIAWKVWLKKAVAGGYAILSEQALKRVDLKFIIREDKSND